MRFFAFFDVFFLNQIDILIFEQHQMCHIISTHKSAEINLHLSNL